MRFESGYSDYLDALEAARSAFEAMIALAEARRDRQMVGERPTVADRIISGVFKGSKTQAF